MTTLQHIRNGNNNSTPDIMAGFLNSDFLYGTHVTLDAGAIAYRYNSITNTYQTIDLSTVASNHMELPIPLPDNDHYALPCGVDDQDHMIVAGNHEVANPVGNLPTTTHFIECTNVNDFTNPASWQAMSSAAWDDLDAYDSSKTTTYHIFERLSNGTLLHFLSQAETGTSTRGRDFLGFKRIAGVWSPIVGDGHFATTEDVNDGVQANRVQITGVHVFPNSPAAAPGVDRVHVSGIWRPNDTSIVGQGAPWCIFADSNALSTWYHYANPTPVARTMPITWANRAGAEIHPNETYATPFGICCNVTTGYPAVQFEVGNTGVINRYRWDGTQWLAAAQPVVAGNIREVNILNQRWLRHSVVGRIVLRRSTDAATVRIGSAVKTSGTSVDTNHCPIWLRERNIYVVNIGDGNTPKLWTFGNNAKMRI